MPRILLGAPRGADASTITPIIENLATANEADIGQVMMLIAKLVPEYQSKTYNQDRSHKPILLYPIQVLKIRIRETNYVNDYPAPYFCIRQNRSCKIWSIFSQ